MIYSNQEEFHPESYGEKRVEHYSTLVALQFNEK
jgi:hypothetical protein